MRKVATKEIQLVYVAQFDKYQANSSQLGLVILLSP